jgi:hypothetical protein
LAGFLFYVRERGRKMADKIVISLTGRPPVRISIGRWPLASEATHRLHHDGAHVDIYVRVRQHADGRTIVYGRYHDGHEWQRAGYLLPAGRDIPAAVSSVTAQLTRSLSGCQ